jgi:hypothetical protein
LPLGYNLSINQTPNQLVIDVKSTTEKGLAGSYLMLHQRGKILFNKLETENKNSYFLSLPTNDLRDRVTHLTLFNSEGNPVCERLVFIENPKNEATIKIKKDKNVLGPKEKLSLKLNVEDSNGTHLSSYLSLSVRNSNTIPYNNRSKNIKTWLLLNSDLRGYIKNPGYFFSKTSNYKRRYLLDLVMMTNDWRRFTWQNLLSGKNQIKKYPFEKGITISGTTNLLKKPYSLAPAHTSLTFIGEQISEEPIQKSSSDGKFSFGPFIFYDSIQTIIQSRLTDFKSKKEKDRALLISMDEAIPSPKIIRNSTIKTPNNEENKTANYLKITKYISDTNFQYDLKSQNLDEVIVLSKKKIKEDERKQEMDDISTFDFPNYRLDVASNETLSNQTVINLLNQFHGLTFNGKGFSARGAGDPRILLDDIIVEFPEIENLPASQISFIDFYSGANASLFSNRGKAPNAANGVLVIYTRRGNSIASRKVNKKQGIINITTEGFYIAREFYAPKYINETDEIIKADVRTTLHWEPKIRITKQNQTQEISFYTCDMKGDYIIEIEGISDSGIPLHHTSRFSVE